MKSQFEISKRQSGTTGMAKSRRGRLTQMAWPSERENTESNQTGSSRQESKREHYTSSSRLIAEPNRYIDWSGESWDTGGFSNPADSQTGWGLLPASSKSTGFRF